MSTPQRLSPEDEAEVRALVARLEEHQSDVGPLTAEHTPGTVIVNVAGRRLLGRDSFRSAMEAALSSPLKDVRTSLEVLDVRAAAAGVAIVSCTKTIHDERPEAPTTVPEAGALTYVVVRSGEGWQVALAQTTPTGA
ncbi:SgcJ/EcaC family oxidoreductase [Nocardiopsis coralliicola]